MVDWRWGEKKKVICKTPPSRWRSSACAVSGRIGIGRGGTRGSKREKRGFLYARDEKEKKHMRAPPHQSEIYTKREQVSDVRVSLR